MIDLAVSSSFKSSENFSDGSYTFGTSDGSYTIGMFSIFNGNLLYFGFYYFLLTSPEFIKVFKRAMSLLLAPIIFMKSSLLILEDPLV